MTTLVEAPSRWRAWAVALRPLSLPVAIAPVLVGAAAGQAHAGRIDLLAALLALLAALLMQLLTNLQNDVGYTLRSDRPPSAAGQRFLDALCEVAAELHRPAARAG